VSLVFDTGVLLAALDADDDYHQRCRPLFSDSAEDLVIPSPVLVELDYWLVARRAMGAFQRLTEDIASGSMLVEDLTLTDYLRVREIREQYHDSDVGFVDAAVLAVCERLRESKLATLDERHFRMLRPRHVPALELLPGR
jgi:predicted nucleic acid-binding protein